MTKALNSHRETKKQPAMTLKEKRQAKKTKDVTKTFLGSTSRPDPYRQ
jgi:hypothetical protein